MSPDDIMRLFREANDFQRAMTPVRYFVKRVFDRAEDVEQLCDLVVHGLGDGIAPMPEKMPFYGVSVLPEGRMTIFYPIVWTNEFGNKIHCWYRIK